MNGGGVVIESWTAVLEKGGNEDDAEFAGKLAEAVGDRARQRIGEIEEGGVLDGAEIGSEEQFLRDDDVRSDRRSLADQDFMVIEGFCLGGEGAGLEESEAWHAGNLKITRPESSPGGGIDRRTPPAS